MEKSVIPQDVLDRLFLKARSYTGWREGTTIPDAMLRELYEIAKMAPTTSNSQPGRFVFVRTPEGREKLSPALSGSNRTKVMAAPVTVIVAYDLDFPDDMDRFYHVKGAGNWYISTDRLREDTALRNSSLQGAWLMMAARALGLDCGPMSGFDNAKVDAAFFPGGRIKSNFLCNLGYGDPAKLPPTFGRRTFEENCSFA